MAEDTVDLPKIGKVKRSYVLVGLAVVGTAVVIYYRNRKAAAATGGLTTDPAGNVGTIDPTTGFVYGSPQDLDALNSMAGSSSTSGGAGGGGSSSGAGDTSTQVSNGPPFASNAAWAQYAADQLTARSPGTDPGTIANDLGKYLAGQEVTVAERDVITQAIAFAGPVPVSGPNGYPPSIRVAGSTAGTGGPPAAPHPTVATVGRTTATIKWTPVTGATSYGWRLSEGDRHGTVGSPQLDLTVLKPNTQYAVSVHSNNTHGPSVDTPVTFRTKP